MPVDAKILLSSVRGLGAWNLLGPVAFRSRPTASDMARSVASMGQWMEDAVRGLGREQSYIDL